jgi:hypothetical protein
MGDNVTMNGIGIGTSVGLGAMIGLGVVSPDSPVGEYIVTFLFYGIFAGLIFGCYRMLFAWKPRPPFGGSR